MTARIPVPSRPLTDADLRAIVGRSSSPPGDWTDALSHLRRRHRDGTGPVEYVGGPGDSVTEGAGASSRASTWWSVFGDAVATALGQSSRSPRSAEVTEQSRWSIWTCSGIDPGELGLGMGGYSLALFPASVLATTQPCDAVTLLHSQVPELEGRSGGLLEVRIDGEVHARLDGGGDGIVLSRAWCSESLGFGRHTVELECVDGDFALVDHAYFHDGDRDTGARFWRCAHHGYDSSEGWFGFANPQWGWMGAFGTGRLFTLPGTDVPVHGSGSIAADCFLIATGTNDIKEFRNDPARIAAGYAAIITYIRRRCDTPASIGIVAPTSSSQFGGDYRHLVEGARAACRSEGAFLIDLSSDLGTHADDSCGFFEDGMHPNDRGHDAWGRYVAAWLLDAVASSPETSRSSG